MGPWPACHILPADELEPFLGIWSRPLAVLCEGLAAVLESVEPVLGQSWSCLALPRKCPLSAWRDNCRLCGLCECVTAHEKLLIPRTARSIICSPTRAPIRNRRARRAARQTGRQWGRQHGRKLAGLPLKGSLEFTETKHKKKQEEIRRNPRTSNNKSLKTQKPPKNNPRRDDLRSENHQKIFGNPWRTSFDNPTLYILNDKHINFDQGLDSPRFCKGDQGNLVENPRGKMINSTLQSLDGLHFVCLFGRARAVTARHILIIGLTDDTMPVIQELCTAHEEKGGYGLMLIVVVMFRRLSFLYMFSFWGCRANFQCSDVDRKALNGVRTHPCPTLS